MQVQTLSGPTILADPATTPKDEAPEERSKKSGRELPLLGDVKIGAARRVVRRIVDDEPDVPKVGVAAFGSFL